MWNVCYNARPGVLLDRPTGLCPKCPSCWEHPLSVRFLVAHGNSCPSQTFQLASSTHRCNRAVTCNAVEAYCKSYPDGRIDHLENVEAFHQPSEEFLSLCRKQLNLLAKLLNAEGGEVRSAVYARTTSSLEKGSLQLVSVATSGPAAPYAAGRAAAERMDNGVLVLGSSGGCVSDAVAEERLVAEDVITLPDTGAVVLPLAHQSRLVGLMVVERAPVRRRNSGTSGAVRDGVSGHWVTVDDQQGRVDVAINDSRSYTPAGQAGGDMVLYTYFRSLFSQMEIEIMRQVADILLAACALDQRAALEATRHLAKRMQVKGLIDEVHAPLRTLRTLGALLVPRLEAGDQGRDMAQGMLVQGDRLQAVVSQLQAALHPWAHPQHNRAAPPPPLWNTPTTPGGPPTPPPFSPPTPHDLPPRPPLPPTTPTAGSSFTTAAARNAPSTLPLPPTSPLTPPIATSATPLPGPQLDRQHSMLVMPRQHGTMGNVQQPQIVERLSGGKQRNRLRGVIVGDQGGGSMDRLSSYDEYGWVDTSVQEVDRSSEAVSVSGRSWEAGECNTSEMIVQLVRTASETSGRMGVVLHVSPPLRKQLLRQPHESSAALQAGGDTLTLKKPPRPLIAAVPAAVLSEAMRHLLDGALQRTPRGGVVKLGARCDSKGGGIIITLSDNGISMAHRLAAQLRRAVNQPENEEDLDHMDPCDATIITSCTANKAAALAAEESREDAANAMQKLSAGLPVGSGMVGLAVAQHLVEEVGGHITVKHPTQEGARTADERQGVVVELWLPQKKWA